MLQVCLDMMYKYYDMCNLMPEYIWTSEYAR